VSRPNRITLVVGGAFVLATLVAVATTSSSAYSDPLDPANAEPSGARAVARVLEHQGVRVSVARGAQALDRTTLDERTTVVVTSAENLGPSTTRGLLDHLGSASLVVVDPPTGALRLFDLPEGVRMRDQGAVRGRCADVRFDRLRVRVDRATAYPGAGACFPTDDGGFLVRAAGRPVTVLGAGDLLSNEQVTDADNAAVALRLLGSRDRLVWYVPSLDDLGYGDAVSLGSLLPRWLAPGLWLLGLSVLALALWRGRRLGPLVTEPLPVTVTAIESTRSRGRLYRKAADRGHAAAVLRRGARARIAGHLRLPLDGPPDALVAAVSAHTGTDPGIVRGLLADADPPRNDKDLTQLARDLAELDREVRRR